MISGGESGIGREKMKGQSERGEEKKVQRLYVYVQYLGR